MISWIRIVFNLFCHSFDLIFENSKKSETRRGVPCWYKKVGLTAVNDFMTVDSCVYTLLRSLPENLPINQLVELFNEVTLITQQGQTLDMQNSELPEVDLSKFTIENYSGRI